MFRSIDIFVPRIEVFSRELLQQLKQDQPNQPLLYEMYLLVHRNYPMIVPKTPPVIPEVFMTDTTIDPILEERPPVRPDEQTAPPPLHKVDPVEIEIAGESNFNERIITVKSPFKRGLGLGGQMVPFIKIAPQYPANAATKGV